MTDKKDKVFMPLKTITDLNNAMEWLWNEQRVGAIDSRSADALNTTLKGAMYLRATLPLKVFEAMVRAQIKKINVPVDLLPQITQS